MTITQRELEQSSDWTIRARLLSRDQSALAEIYRIHSGAVFSLAGRVTNNRSLAEDVTQEVFLRVWNHPDRFDPARGTLRTFLLSQTHGRSVDLIRSESSRRMREDKQTRLADEAGPTVEEEILEIQTAEAVRKALRLLEPGERTAIELAYFGGRSYREVATILEQPEGTVKSRIRSGLKKLGEALGEQR
jgi:RNA polymerase sigma-70 factor (ECF subfamily)